MTFDEFLLSNDTIFDFETNNTSKKSILKIKYNNNVDFIYIPFYGNFEYDKKLDFIGMFEKNTRKLYGDSFYFKDNYYKSLCNSLFECSISDIYDKAIKEANILLNSYIEKNKSDLLKQSQSLFDKFISFENNFRKIKLSAIHDYIYNQEINITFSIDSHKNEQEIRDITMQYIQNPIETVENLYNQYRNNTEKKEYLDWYEDDTSHDHVTANEYIGVKLHQQELYKNLRNQLEQNPNNEYRKTQKIIQSIKDFDAQMLTITIKHNETIITFKYPKKKLYNLEYSEYNFPDLKIREQINELYKDRYNKNNLFLSEIMKIEYNRKILYEDHKLLGIENHIQETHDIVDDIFE